MEVKVKNKTIIEKEREYRPYVRLWQDAESFLDLGKNIVPGYKKFIRASLLLYSFAFEAFLNHIGASVFKNSWTDEYERAMDITEKSKKIYDSLGLEFNLGRNPLQKTLNLMNKYRNNVVHSKTKILNYKKIMSGIHVDSKELTKPILNLVELDETLENVLDVKKNLELLFREIHEIAKKKEYLPEYDFVFVDGLAVSSSKFQGNFDE